MRPSDRASATEREQVTLVDVEGVSVTHRGQVVLRGVSLHMSAGERVVLVGTPGPGRSTLLATVGTLMQPTSGTMRLAGVDVIGLQPGQLADLRAQQLGLVLPGAGLVSRPSPWARTWH